MAKKGVKINEVIALRMPGFSAEASLYTSQATYRAVGGSGVTSSPVQPAVCWYCDDEGCGFKPCKRARLA